MNLEGPPTRMTILLTGALLRRKTIIRGALLRRKIVIIGVLQTRTDLAEGILMIEMITHGSVTNPIDRHSISPSLLSNGWYIVFCFWLILVLIPVVLFIFCFGPVIFPGSILASQLSNILLVTKFCI